jgi:ribosomal protein S18 acetylase RimI-like enzyme
MSLIGFTLRTATAHDAGALARLAERTFRETFGPHNSAEDMDGYCGDAFTVERQRAELDDPARQVLLLERAGELAGYAMLWAGPVPDCVTGGDPIELLRFYIDGAWHGRGAAGELMGATIAAAGRRGARTVFLAVWERNLRAIGFYTKHGFRDVGGRPFQLGSDVQTDRIMVAPVTTS